MAPPSPLSPPLPFLCRSHLLFFWEREEITLCRSCLFFLWMKGDVLSNGNFFLYTEYFYTSITSTPPQGGLFPSTTQDLRARLCLRGNDDGLGPNLQLSSTPPQHSFPFPHSIPVKREQGSLDFTLCPLLYFFCQSFFPRSPMLRGRVFLPGKLPQLPLKG